MKTVHSLMVLAVLVTVLAVAGGAWAGTFTDRDGTAHSWSIDASHALVWDGAHYLPFGVVFEPRYLTADGQTEENLKADGEDIAAFKLAGITDVYVKPAAGISSVPAEALQKIIDLLESNDLRYGIELFDPPYAPISGYVVQPTVNRADRITTPGQITGDFPDSKSVLYVFCSAMTGEIKDVNQAVVVDGQVSVRVNPDASGEHVLLFYPQKAIAPTGPDAGLPDMWSDYDRHRDRLLFMLKQIKFGKGLRFIADPFTENIGLGGNIQDLIPASPRFRLEYATWLAEKYGTARDLSLAWGVLKHEVATFEEATRYIPLWNYGRGVPAVYDLGTSQSYPADATQSRIWNDFREFRADSIRSYLDAMGDALKRLAVDVPVVYTATGLERMFQAQGAIGYDGLAVPPGATRESSLRNAGQAFSLAESTTRKMWLISRVGAAETPFAKKEDLFAEINAARDLGAKGFFTSGSTGTAIQSANVLVWLAEYASLSAKDAQFARYKPQAVYYPKDASSASVKRLPSGVWWLPTLVPGLEKNIGGSFACYSLLDPKTGESDVYVWSTKGERTITLVTSQPIKTVTTLGQTTEFKPKKDRVEITVNEEPLIVRGITPEMFLPIETVTEALDEFKKVIDKAEQTKLEVSDYRKNLKTAREMIGKNQIALSWQLVQMSMNELTIRMRGMKTQVTTDTTAPAGS